MRIILLAVVLLLYACQTLDDAGQAGTYRIPSGTVIDLHQDLIIPRDQAGVYIQGTPIGDRYHYDATCRLEVRSVNGLPREVKADQFTVDTVSREWDFYSGRGSSGALQASLFSGDGCPCLLYYATYIYLRSERQPDVFRLVCGHLQDSASGPRHLTAEEIRTTLSPVMTLR